MKIALSDDDNDNKIKLIMLVQENSAQVSEPVGSVEPEIEFLSRKPSPRHDKQFSETPNIIGVEDLIVNQTISMQQNLKKVTLPLARNSLRNTLQEHTPYRTITVLDLINNLYPKSLLIYNAWY